ncbi:fimbrial protein [Ralstonia holmesii]|uniref:Major fimbrial subunit SMF-1 n=1 Tax=Ralstonia holmesii TaxID=3058602 RepID=A0ABC8QGR9_9RALS|nr:MULTISPECIES: fimbrial protein [Ralstonia]CAJ0695771.1 Major fimbrial subunit SMF-1 [Ralstonia sp. LMG 32967]CAJ0793667.1 Major fimbrial subunit SMF-1 [Ralstonia sp. LMG 32967]CAJ0819196.1 Major fimbrial subunit SMF-1 [Ralstonia sp. LMG 32967]
MKMAKLSLSIAAVLGMALTSAQASATDGTISFTGQLVGSTCKINGNDSGTQTNVNVTLPTLSVTALRAVGSTAGVTPFQLNLTSCSGASAQTHFEIGSTVDSATGALVNQTAGGSNAQVQLLNDKYQPINITTNANSQTVTITDGSATMQYYAQYLAAKAAANAGQVTSQVTFSMNYN